MAKKRKFKFEGSKADIASDKKAAKKANMSVKNYEKSAADKKADKRGR